MEETSMLTIDEAARLIGISAAAVRSLAVEGELAPEKGTAGEILISREEATAFAESRRRMQAGLNAAAAEARATGLFVRRA